MKFVALLVAVAFYILIVGDVTIHGEEDCYRAIDERLVNIHKLKYFAAGPKHQQLLLRTIDKQTLYIETTYDDNCEYLIPKED